MDIDKLMPASWFYINDNEKTKFNWFLYEYAGKLFDAIMTSRDKALKKWKARHSDEELAGFCAYFSKRMRQSVYDVQLGIEDGAVFLDRYVSDCCHTATLEEVNAVIEIASKAWEGLLTACLACPNGCLDEADCRCDTFDRIEHGGRCTY